MDDTHDPGTEDTGMNDDEISALAEMDPAEAPAAAEALAADLAGELESAGAPAQEAVSPRPDRPNA